MFKANDDGVGFMTVRGGRVLGKKFKEFEGFYQALREVPRRFPIVVHFRLATHGGKGAEHAQPFPFPVVAKKELFALEWEAQAGVAHNGILSSFGDSLWEPTLFPKTVDGVEVFEYWSMKEQAWIRVKSREEKPTREQSLSDTQDFLWFLSNKGLVTKGILWRDRGVLDLVSRWTQTKLLFLFGETGKARLLGVGWVQEKGLWFSNTYWKNRGKGAVVVYSGARNWDSGYRRAVRGYTFEGDGGGEEKGKEEKAKEEDWQQGGASQRPLRELSGLLPVEDYPSERWGGFM